MEQKKWRSKGLKAVSVTLAMLFTFGVSGTAVTVLAAENTPPPNAIRDMGTGTPTHLDFDNPPPIPEGFFPADAGGDVQVLGEELPGFIETIASFLAEALLGWAIGRVLNYAASDILEEMFGNSLQTKMAAVKNNNGVILDRLEQIINTVNMMEYKEIITAKTRKMNELWNKYVVKETALRKEMPAEKRMAELQMYFDGTDSNYVLDVIDYYTTYVEGNGMLDGSVFATYDGYALYNYYWESEGYDFRESTRALDLVYFSQMWVLAFAACQAHIDGKTDERFEAQAAQNLLLDCISMPVDGRTPEVTGIFDLFEKTPVVRLMDDYYIYQVPGRKTKFYIPTQGYENELDINRLNRTSVGMNPYDLLDKLFCWSNGHHLANFDQYLKPIENYYRAAGKQLNMHDVFFNLTKDKAFVSEKAAGFMASNDFMGALGRNIATHNYYARLAYGRSSGVAFVIYNGDVAFSAPIVEIIMDVGVLSGQLLLRVFLVEDESVSPPEPDVAISGEVTSSGVVTALGEGTFTLTLEDLSSSQPITEQVLVGPETRMLDGSLVGDMQELINCRVEVNGIYTFADKTLAAETITVKDDSGIQTTSGTVVSSVANAVMVLEDATGSTNGYFLPDVQEDLPTGSRISISYHWENGVKIVNSYELQEVPVPTPAPAPDPAPAKDPDPSSGPVDDPENSRILPQAA